MKTLSSLFVKQNAGRTLRTVSVSASIGSSGFSLVEVAMALGIIAFSVMALIGLIPTGLSTFHKAVGLSVGTQIVQHVVADVQQSDFSQLSQQNTPLYFDDQGNQVASSKFLYEVNVVVNTPAGMPGGGTSPNLASVLIEVVRNPGKQALSYDAGHSVRQDSTRGIYVSRYSVLIAKNQ